MKQVLQNKYKMIKKIILFCFFFSFSVVNFSQIINFEGTVIDKTAEPVENAIVTIEGTEFSMKTDEEGKFLFKEEIPLGERIITVTSLGFITKVFTVVVEKGKNIVVEEVTIKLTKDEKRRRWVMSKVRKEEERRIGRDRKKVTSLLKKEKEAKEVEAKEIEGTVVTDDEKSPIDSTIEKEPENVITTSSLQEKYAKELDVPTSSIFNMGLYEFVDKWRGTVYLEGGKTMDGIDDSFFSQRLVKDVFGMNMEDSVEEQFKSKFTDKFTDTKYLREGDLIFFKGSGDKSKDVVHVGVYLLNNKFIHSISLKNKNNHNGVKISDIRNPFWKSRLASCGRRIFN